jgi:drug/metabolite transporter (DMT)-like permease
LAAAVDDRALDAGRSRVDESTSLTAILLALMASASWGVADFAGGLLSRRLPALVVLLGQQATALVICGVVIAAAGEGLPSDRAIALSLAAGVCGAIALGAFYRSLALGTMSIAAPISASGAVVPVLVGVATGDRPTALQTAGLAITLAGVILASREASAEGDGSTDRRRSILLALLAAVFFGTYFSLSDVAADESVLWLLALGRAAAVPLLVGVAIVSGTLRLPERRDVVFVAGVGVADLIATGLYAVALTEGLLSIVAVVGALYPVTTVLLARAVLHERLRPAQAAGVALAFTGVAAVAAG